MATDTPTNSLPASPLASPTPSCGGDGRLHKPSVKRESLQARFERYCHYFAMQPEQLSRMYRSCLSELDAGLEMHKASPSKWLPERCSLMFLDTCVDVIPTGKEKGVFYGVDFGGTNLRAVRVELDGCGSSTRTQSRTNMRLDSHGASLPRGLLDKEATATMLFDAIACQVKKLMEEQGDMDKENVGIGFTFSFAIEQKKLTSAILMGWSKGFETGLKTKDAVVGRDVCTLLDVALERNNVPATVVAALNDTTGTLLSAAYERSKNVPPCLIGIILGTGMNGCYYQPNAEEWGYQGRIINTELGGFDKDLPWNIIDIEVDFASTNRGRHRLEKMVSALYLPELCRRSIIKVFQEEAPTDAWAHESLSGEGCAAIVNDNSESLSVTREVLKLMWDWSPSDEKVAMIKKLFTTIFDRSAALAAVVIAAMAKKTGKLQPAMGGLGVGVDGSLYTQNEIYRKMIVKHLNTVLGEDTASLIHFAVADDGSGKGAAILAGTLMQQRKQDTRRSAQNRSLR